MTDIISELVISFDRQFGQTSEILRDHDLAFRFFFMGFEVEFF